MAKVIAVCYICSKPATTICEFCERPICDEHKHEFKTIEHKPVCKRGCNTGKELGREDQD